MTFKLLRSNRTFWLSSLALVCAGVAGVTFISGSEASPSGEAPSAAPLQTSVGQFSVFARAATDRDDIASWRATKVDTRSGKAFSRARVVFEDSSRVVAAVPSGNEAPCLVAQYKDGSGGSICGKNRVSVSMGYDGALGLVPDSVKTVTFKMTDGTTETARVVNNIWRSPIEASSATFALNGRTEVVHLMPQSERPAGTTLSDTGVVSGGD